MARRLAILALLAPMFALTASGCTRLGDFDRPEPNFFNNEDVNPGFLPRKGWSGYLSPNNLTEDERALRNLAYAIITPPMTRQKWLQIVRYEKKPFEPESYFNALMETPFRSANGRYARIADDIRADNLRVIPFFTAARRVAELDEARERSFAGVTGLTAEERDAALDRIAQNRVLVEWVSHRFTERVRGYRFALERLFLKSPSPAAVDVERALAAFDQRLAHVAGIAPPVIVTQGPPPDGVISK
jgi:hypothetical protein